MLLAEVQEVGNGLVCNVCDKAFESSRKLYFHNHYKHSVASTGVVEHLIFFGRDRDRDLPKKSETGRDQARPDIKVKPGELCPPRQPRGD